MREYEGLKGLHAVGKHIQRAVFSQGVPTNVNEVVAKPSHQVEKPTTVPLPIWNHLTKTLNEHQIFAIAKILKNNTISLVQGPPGTGKSSTIIGLVTALLNGVGPKSGGKSPGTRIQAGQSFTTSKRLSANSSTNPGVTSVKSKILVCAASNQAVDDLAFRINNECLGPGGKLGKFKMARFGSLPWDDRNNSFSGRKNMKRLLPASHKSKRDVFLHKINLDTLAEEAISNQETHISAKGSLNSADTNNTFHNLTSQRRAVISQCNVVLATLCGSGSKSFIDSVARDDVNTKTERLPSQEQREFDVVIVDEACQASEPLTLIPFKFNPKLVILMGDPQQLPVLVFSDIATQAGLGRSLFERFRQIGWPSELICVQYRMHKEIAMFPSNAFYDGRLITGVQRPEPHWYKDFRFPPYRIWNIPHGKMSRTPHGGICNHEEASFIISNLLLQFCKAYGKSAKIGIITFYNSQVQLLKNKIQLLRSKINDFPSIQVATVDGFQGSEKDIIILSCVRSHGSKSSPSVGFLGDHRRLNVALTRARLALWIVGNCSVLRHDIIWNKMLSNANERYLVYNGKEFERKSQRVEKKSAEKKRPRFKSGKRNHT